MNVTFPNGVIPVPSISLQIWCERLTTIFGLRRTCPLDENGPNEGTKCYSERGGLHDYPWVWTELVSENVYTLSKLKSFIAFPVHHATSVKYYRENG